MKRSLRTGKQIRSTARRYFRRRQHGPAWKCIHPKKNYTEISRRELL